MSLDPGPKPARAGSKNQSIDFRWWAIPLSHNQRLTIGPRWTRQSARTICLVARQGLSADPARTPTCCWKDHHVAGGRRAAGVPADLFSTRHCGSRPARHVCEAGRLVACCVSCQNGDEPKSALQDAQQHGSNDHVSAKQQSAQAADKSKAAHDHSTQANNKSQPCRSAENARRTAERLAPARAGVVAFSTAGDAELGDYDDEPTIIFKTGHLPAHFEET